MARRRTPAPAPPHIDNACSRCGAPLAGGATDAQLAAHAYWDNGQPFCGPACAELTGLGRPGGEPRPKLQAPSTKDLVDGGTVRRRGSVRDE